MSEKKAMFHRVMQAIVDGRSRVAQRYVDDYLKTRGIDRETGK